MRFEKWQALGNDYVIVEAAELPAPLTAPVARALCDRHTGIGADGILLLEAPDEPGYVARLRIFNPDGSEAELSGNGAREAIMYLRHRGWTDREQFSIRTVAGEIRPTILSETTCRVDMGRAKLRSRDFPSGGDDGVGEVESGGRTWRFQHVSIGNPQCAIPVASVDAVEALDLAVLGPAIEHSDLFPNRTNVSWFAPTAEPGVIRARIFERGVGETTASGTGACGAAVAYVLRGGDSPVTVRLDGGELEVDVGEDLHVDLTGWAVPVYAGTLSDADRVFAQRLGE
jgi:diaminopimelate epimerase